MKMKDSIRDWWDKSSEYYQAENRIPTDDALYGPFSPGESELNLLGDIKNKRILEIGCGGGQSSIAFAKRGAKCTAIDISGTQLDYANKLAEKNGVKIKFLQMNAADVGKFGRTRFDLVFSALVLNQVGNLGKCFSGVKRILKKGGKFVFSVEHPFYILMSPSDLRIDSSYYDTGRVRDKDGYIFFKRRISDIVNLMIDSGLVLDRIVEPFKQKHGKSAAWETGYRMKLVRKIAPTIIFSAVNP